ncbi:MAG: NUDIX domain-containing protein [Tepidisphaeraceae bacterium]|jgi:dATP pyrophosphohydrolase
MKIRYDMVCCFVIRPGESGRGWEFLQLRRSADDFLGGTWQTIYGESHAGETPVDAALRELREETGVFPDEFFKLSDAHVFYIAAHDTLWHSIQFCAMVNREATIVMDTEHDAFRWLGAEEAEVHFMWPGDRRSIQEIRGQIIGNGLAKPFMRVELPGR